MKQTKINSISIVLPCYNSQKFIYDTLVSINNQDYNGPLELVCIDDGSTDNTLQIVKKFKFNNKIELVLISRKNKGFLYSILEGVEKSKSEFIARIDSDDIWLPNHLSVLMSYFKKICSISRIKTNIN